MSGISFCLGLLYTYICILCMHFIFVFNITIANAFDVVVVVVVNKVPFRICLHTAKAVWSCQSRADGNNKNKQHSNLYKKNWHDTNTYGGGGDAKAVAQDIAVCKVASFESIFVTIHNCCTNASATKNTAVGNNNVGIVLPRYECLVSAEMCINYSLWKPKKNVKQQNFDSLQAFHLGSTLNYEV